MWKYCETVRMQIRRDYDVDLSDCPVVLLLCSSSYLTGNTNPNIKSQLTNVDDDNHDNDGNGDDDDDGKGGDV